MRIVCDTNVTLRAFITPGGAAAELVRLIAQHHLLITSKFLLTELITVLRRPKIQALHGCNDRQIRRLISQAYKLSIVVPLPANLPTFVPGDAKDNPVVMTAIAGDADVLCTMDRHLLQPAVIAVCSHHGVRVLTDSQLLPMLRAN
jgi:putative PIN family toxin of toxin-antitoxin system